MISSLNYEWKMTAFFSAGNYSLASRRRDLSISYFEPLCVALHEFFERFVLAEKIV